MITSERFKYIWFFLLLVAALVLIYLVFRPFLAPLFIAVICAVLFGGLHRHVQAVLPTSKNFAAAISVTAVLIFIVVPLILLGALVFNEARDFYNSFSIASTPAGLLNEGLLVIQENIQAYVPQANINLESYVQSGLQWILEHMSLFFSGFLKIVLDLFIMVIALFYLFRDGAALKKWVIELSPLDTTDDEDILRKLAITVNSVIKGTLIIAVIQGALTGLALGVAGVSQPVLWGLVAAVASLVPGIGTSLVHIPAILYLLVTGHVYAAVGYLLWATLLVGTIDNIVSPLLIERKVKIHPLLILISVLGGLVFFGPIGFLVGPVILAFVTELFKLYPKFSKNA